MNENKIKQALERFKEKRIGIQTQILINKTYSDDAEDFRREREEEFALGRKNILLEQLAVVDNDINKLGLKLKQIKR